MSNDYRNCEGYPDPTAGEALSRIAANEKHSLRAFRPIVYICSPFSGDVEGNVANARRYSRFAVDKGYIPIAPHLLFPQFLDDDNPDERELGLFFGNALMSKCAEVWVFGSRISSMSENIKLGLQYRYQQGKLQVNHNRFLGYTKDENGNLVIDPEQAEIVKRIYREYLEGSSMDKIASGLMADGILTGAGKEKWHTSTINKILRNEKYMGDALLQKTYTTDFLTKKRIKNNGTVPQYYVEGDHEAIIPKDLFMQVQAELVRRRAVHISPTGKKRGFSCNHCFAQMIFCGDCGELYRRVHWNNHGCKSIVWRCISRLEPSSAEMNCTNRTVNELLLQEVTVKAINQILTESDTFLKQLQANIAKAVVNADTLSPDGIQARLEELQKELIKKANNKQDYDSIADEFFRLREQKEQSEVDSHHREETMNRIKELQSFIAKQKTDITEFDEALVKKLIKKVTVFTDHFTVEFKSGLAIEIEA